METTIQRVLVFRLTVQAERKCFHDRIRPINRQILNDSKARAAVGATDKGVKITPVSGIQQLLFAVRAEGGIRGNSDDGLALAGRST